jgi:dihydropteroate synthase
VKLRCRDEVLSLDRTAIMGVLNVTPDSFSDGGLWLEPKAAADHALEMLEQGAAIIDVGGESTRPGASPVPQNEELERVLPVIDALSSAGVQFISIDTRKKEVARRAVDAGANIVNDTTGEASDRSLDEVAVAHEAGYVVMHSRGTPETMRSLTDYSDVVAHIRSFFERRVAELEGSGLQRDSIVVDPGFGFAKNPDQNLVLLKRLSDLTSLGYPLMAGTSRKSFIGHVLGLSEDQRLEGTVATVCWAVAAGARLLRVHDVRPVSRAVRMIEAIAGQQTTD